MKTYFAFHNDAVLQVQVLAEVGEHVAADRVIQGTYGNERGACFIGCLAGGDDPVKVYERTGFPETLTRIAENIFEGLPASECPAFFHDALHAPALGSDLSLAPWQFLYEEVREALEACATPEVRSGCAHALDVLARRARGEVVGEQKACVARAYAAADVPACAAAAYAAAADVAAYAAAHAAYATYAAADARASGSYTLARQKQAQRLITLLKSAKPERKS